MKKKFLIMALPCPVMQAWHCKFMKKEGLNKMDEETGQYIQAFITGLKNKMRENGVIFAIAADGKDINNSKLRFIDKKKYITSGKTDGISVGLTELNNGLLD